MMIVRNLLPNDETRWRGLWGGYNDFYRAVVPEKVTAHTWRRLLDPSSPILGRVVVTEDQLAGFSLSVIHEGTWTLTPICYLEDLFVDPVFRGRGIGRKLIDDVITTARSQGLSRVYWHTQAGNPARTLYDSFGKADDFVRYRIMLQ